jgi:hypothetical protein
MQARPHWRSGSDLTVVPLANGAGVPQMGKNDPISGRMASEAALPGQDVDMFKNQW